MPQQSSSHEPRRMLAEPSDGDMSPHQELPPAPIEDGWLAKWRARRTCEHDWVLVRKYENMGATGLEQPFGGRRIYVYRYRCSKCGKRKRQVDRT
jgi:hypothetical protein